MKAEPYVDIQDVILSQVVDGRSRAMSPREKRLYEQAAFLIDELCELARMRGGKFACPCHAVER